MAKIKDVETALKADLDAVRTDLTAIADGIATQNKLITDLQSRVANGGEVSDAEIQPLLDQGQQLKDAADALAASLAPAAPAAQDAGGDTTGS